MTRGGIVVSAVVLLAALASVQAVINVMIPVDPRNDMARDLMRTELESSPVPYTKKFYLTFGPYYAENPISIPETKLLRQMDEIDGSSMPMGG